MNKAQTARLLVYGLLVLVIFSPAIYNPTSFDEANKAFSITMFLVVSIVYWGWEIRRMIRGAL